MYVEEYWLPTSLKIICNEEVSSAVEETTTLPIVSRVPKKKRLELPS